MIKLIVMKLQLFCNLADIVCDVDFNQGWFCIFYLIEGYKIIFLFNTVIFIFEYLYLIELYLILMHLLL